MNWRCWLFRHKFVESRRVSMMSMYVKCSCGREYGVNMYEGLVLPWEKVRELYETPLVGGGASRRGPGE